MCGVLGPLPKGQNGASKKVGSLQVTEKRQTRSLAIPGPFPLFLDWCYLVAEVLDLGSWIYAVVLDLGSWIYAEVLDLGSWIYAVVLDLGSGIYVGVLDLGSLIYTTVLDLGS